MPADILISRLSILECISQGSRHLSVTSSPPLLYKNGDYPKCPLVVTNCGSLVPIGDGGLLSLACIPVKVLWAMVGYVGCLDPDSVATHSNLPGWYTPAVGLLILVTRNEPFSRDCFRLE